VSLLLAPEASLKVFARFCGSHSGCARVDGRVLKSGVANPALASQATTEVTASPALEAGEVGVAAPAAGPSTTVAGGRGQGCEQTHLLSAQAFICLLSHARLLSLGCLFSVAWCPGLCGEGGGGAVSGAAGGILQRKVSFSIPYEHRMAPSSCHHYSCSPG
jgi:hypothetical protein